jgi:hypothetical protein
VNLTSLSLSNVAKLSTVLLSSVLLPAVIGCGKADQEPEASRAIPDVLMISNAEGSSGFLVDSELSSVGAALHGGWYTYDDVEDCPKEDRMGTVSPMKDAQYVMTKYNAMVQPPPEAGDNAEAIRFFGGGYSLWGAGIGVGLNNQGAGPDVYDLTKTKATGLRFWAISPAGDVTIKVKFQDSWSEAEAEPRECCFWDKKTCEPNACNMPAGGLKQGCFAAPLVTRTVTTAWTLISIPFTEFARETWGIYADGMSRGPEVPLEVTKAYQLQIEVGTDPTFDIWIDNVGFTLPPVAAAK